MMRQSLFRPVSTLLMLLILISPLTAQDKAADSAEKPAAAKAAAEEPAATKDASASASASAQAADKADEKDAKDAKDEKDADPLEGHSLHGEVFNEGPRQAAYLMDGVGTVKFDITTENDQARAFFLQGVAQLHGFWYFESERSFRQCAMLDPDCAMAYWGMAMSNRRNVDRAKDFIKEASDRSKKASAREQAYIKAFSEYINAKTDKTEDKQKRAEKYISALDAILIDHPDDLEAKAFMCEFLWSARRDGIKMRSYTSVDAMLQDILDADPFHPAHHYRIHLWDTKKAENALESAARCGMSAPSIAHMWHMPGHIYSRLKRYHDAVYQQEASARVDHAHMMKDQVLPDQIHNFAHNNEWCIRNLVHIGRVRDAIDLACNMTQMPRHPKYNTIKKYGSFKYGRQRLLDVLRTYQLHEELIAFAGTPYLQATGDASEDLKTRRYLASAHAALGQVEQAKAIREELQQELDTQKAEQKKAGDEAEAKARKEKKSDKDSKKARGTAEGKFRTKVRDLEKALQEIDGRLLIVEKKYEEALALFKKSGSVPVEEQVLWMLAAGQTDEAVKRINAHVSTNRNEVRPLAAQVEVLFAAGKKDEALKAFETLRGQSSTIDVDVPAFARLTKIAAELKLPTQWTQEAELADDLGGRPPLDALGPFRWQPQTAANWSLVDTEGQTRSLSDYRGRPVVVIFYLGAGCLHCAEQLQKFAPKADEFRKAGFEMVAVSTDKQKVLHMAYKDLDEKFAFPLVSDAGLETFKAWRCFDDFEDLALHGTFVIDGEGRIRWQDISYEPFMDPDFVLKEAQRLLGQDKRPDTPAGSTLTATGAE